MTLAPVPSMREPLTITCSRSFENSLTLLEDLLVAAEQEVVAEHRGHRDREADGRHDQGLTDRARDLVDRGLAGHADRDERVVDAPHRAEQADERRGRTGGRQERQLRGQRAADARDGAREHVVDPLVQRNLLRQAFVMVLGGVDRLGGHDLEDVALAGQLRRHRS